jgi:hypothetical protein
MLHDDDNTSPSVGYPTDTELCSVVVRDTESDISDLESEMNELELENMLKSVKISNKSSVDTSIKRINTNYSDYPTMYLWYGIGMNIFKCSKYFKLVKAYLIIGLCYDKLLTEKSKKWLSIIKNAHKEYIYKCLDIDIAEHATQNIKKMLSGMDTDDITELFEMLKPLHDTDRNIFMENIVNTINNKYFSNFKFFRLTSLYCCDFVIKYNYQFIFGICYQKLYSAGANKLKEVNNIDKFIKKELTKVFDILNITKEPQLFIVPDRCHYDFCDDHKEQALKYFY